LFKASGLTRVLGELGWVSASQLFTATGRFSILLLVARTLPPDSFGRFSFFVGLSLVIGNVTELGLGRTLVRFAGSARGRSEFALAREYSGAILKVKMALSIAILLLGLVLLYEVRHLSDFPLMTVALVTGLLTSFSPFVASMFQVQGRFREYFCAFLIDPIRLFAVLVLCSLHSVTMQRLLYIYVFSPLLLVWLVPWTGLTLRDLASFTAPSTYERLWGFGKWLFLVALLESVWQRLDVLMLEGLSGPHDVGIYSGAYMFMGVAALVAASVGTVIYPRMAEAHGRNDIADVARQYVTSTDVLAYLGLPCVLGIAALGPLLVKTILGPSYLAAASLFLWLAIYGIFFLLQMNVGAVLFAIGKPQLCFYILLFEVSAGTFGNLCFIPRWHAHAAAAVLAVSTLCTALLSWTVVALCIGAWPNFKRIGMLVIAACVMYVFVRFTPVPLGNESELAVRVLIGVCAYLAVVKAIWKNVATPFGDFAITHS